MELHNGEILYLYDAKDTNPNGDPDAENRPRMDYVGRRLLVSDVRLKRYVRDYLLAQGEDVWVRMREDGSRTDADGRLDELKSLYEKVPEALAGRAPLWRGAAHQGGGG
jgi:CRISPR-associated protein Csh2